VLAFYGIIAKNQVIIYINDLIESCGDDAKIYLFADDDARLYNHIKCIMDAEILQTKNDKFTDWAHRWLVKLSTKQCKSMSFHQWHYDTTTNSFTYKIEGVPLEHVESYSDLGVLFDSFLLFDQHISKIVSKAYSTLGVIQRNFRELSRECFVVLYKSLLRPHVEYANTVWAPRRMCDIEKIEKVQMRATKLIRGLSSRSYEERLRALELPTLCYRQLRGDMIQLFKYVNNKYDANFVLQLQYKSVLEKRYDTKGHRYKLVPQLCKYDLRKRFFVNRLVKVWNSVPDDVVSACSVNSFKSRFDLIWHGFSL